MNLKIKDHLEKTARNLPVLIDPTRACQLKVLGSEAIKRGTKTYKQDNIDYPINPKKFYLMNIRNDIDHYKNLLEAYRAGNTLVEKESNVQMYCDAVVKKYKESNAQADSIRKNNINSKEPMNENETNTATLGADVQGKENLIENPNTETKEIDEVEEEDEEINQGLSN